MAQRVWLCDEENLNFEVNKWQVEKFVAVCLANTVEEAYFKFKELAKEKQYNHDIYCIREIKDSWCKYSAVDE